MSTKISICPECGNKGNNVPTEKGEKILESSLFWFIQFVQSIHPY